MAARCPDAKALGIARLPRHRLEAMREGWLTVVRDARQTVFGLLWDVPFSNMPALDRYEDVAGGLYVKAQQMVIGPSGARRALVYFGANSGPGVLKPDYLNVVIAAAKAAGLPEAVLGQLQRLGAAPARSPFPRLTTGKGERSKS